MKKVLIKVKGTQALDGEESVIELVTEGILKQFENDYIITYTENETIEKARVKTRLTVKNGKTVVLERYGALNSRFLITEGERNSCLYTVSQGSLALGIYGKEVTADFNKNGGTVKMVYTIDANLEPLSENKVEISVEERK